MPLLQTYSFRPRDGTQKEKVEDLIVLYGSSNDALRAAVDLLYEARAQTIEELRPTWEQAQAALEEARKAL